MINKNPSYIKGDLEFMKEEIEKAIKESIKNQFNVEWVNDILNIVQRSNIKLDLNSELLKQAKIK